MITNQNFNYQTEFSFNTWYETNKRLPKIEKNTVLFLLKRKSALGFVTSNFNGKLCYEYHFNNGYEPERYFEGDEINDFEVYYWMIVKKPEIN